MAGRKVVGAALRLPPLPSTGDLVRLYKLRALKHLSQNFLMDPRLTSKLVRSSRRMRGLHVCEVGPGPGNLTRSILEQGAASLTVLEKDPRFLPALELLQDAAQDTLKIELGDVLTYNMERTFPQELGQPWDGPVPLLHIVGNLPFNVATPLIIRWLRAISERTSAWVHGRVPMTLTFQKEVAERMVAPVGHAQRCRLSIMCQNWCRVSHHFTIPGRAFLPKPDVDVGVVGFVPRPQPCIPLPFTLVEKVVRCVFSFRQKYCRHGAGQLFPEADRDQQARKLLLVADVDPTLQPFHLSMAEFSRLCHAYSAMVEQQPSLIKYNARGPKLIVEEHDYFDDADTND